MRRFLYACCAVLFAGAVVFSSAGEAWVISVNANLTLALNSYSNNWIGGEAGSLTWASQLNSSAARQLSAKALTKNTLKLAFGQTETQNKNTKNWSVPQKSTDLIDFESLLQLTLGGFVDPFIGLHAISLFADGSDTLLTRYGNPLDLAESFGVARTILKGDNANWTARLAGAAHEKFDRWKLQDDGTRKQLTTTQDGGIEFVTEAKLVNTAKWATFCSNLKVYEAVISSEAEKLEGTPQADDWRYPDVNWENILALNISKYIMVNVYVQALYDREIATRARIKETLGAGLTYTFDKK